MVSGKTGEVDDVLAPKEIILEKLFVNTNMEAANGSNTVTISAVAPSSVETATIKGWLKFYGSDGVVNYIPYWS